MQSSIGVLEGAGLAQTKTQLWKYMERRGDIPHIKEIRRRLMEQGAAGVSCGWGTWPCLGVHGPLAGQ